MEHQKINNLLGVDDGKIRKYNTSPSNQSKSTQIKINTIEVWFTDQDIKPLKIKIGLASHLLLNKYNI